MPKPRMLTADELERLRLKSKENQEYARQVFGARPKTPDEIEMERQGDEWWATRLAEMRAEEAKKAKE